MRGQHAYPMNETNSIGGVQTYILQSVDAILVYIVTNGPSHMVYSRLLHVGVRLGEQSKMECCCLIGRE